MRSVFRKIYTFPLLKPLTVSTLSRVLTMIWFGTFTFHGMAQPLPKRQWNEPYYLKNLFTEKLLSERWKHNQSDQVSLQDSNLTLIGQWAWGLCYAVTAQNNYAYIGNGKLFQILDISNPIAPQVVGELFVDQLTADITVKNDYAYLAIPPGLLVIDVSNPSDPKVVAKQRVERDWPVRIKIMENRAYLTTALGGFYIFDISDPHNPQFISGAWASGEFAWAVAVYQNFVYVGTASGGGIDIFDISGSTPRQVGLYPEASRALAISGKYLYTLMRSTPNFQVFDLSSPAQPQQIGGLDLPTRADGLDVVGHYAYLTIEDSTFLILDISIPTTPRLLAKINRKGLSISGSGPRSISVQSGLAYVETETGLWIISVENPTNPREVNFFATGGSAAKINVIGEYAYIAAGSGGFRILDVSDPSHPKSVGHFSTESFVTDLVVSNQYAFLIDWPISSTYPSHFWILDISQPRNPREVARFAGITHASNSWIIGPALEISGNYAFITQSDSGLIIIDIANKAKPSVIGFWPSNGFPHDVAVSGKYAFLANIENSDKGLRVINISSPDHPQEKGYAAGWTSGVCAKHDTVYAAIDGGLRIFKIDTNGHPVKLGEVATPGGRTGVDISVSGKFAYMAYGYNLVVVDVSSVTQPHVVGLATIYTGVNGATSEGDRIYVAADWGGLQIYRNDYITSVGEMEPSNLPTKQLVLRQNYPNPFNAQTAIEYELPEPGWVILKIFNLAGEEVATLVNAKQMKGRHIVSFDASKLASGVYIYHLKINHQAVVKRMLIMK